MENKLKNIPDKETYYALVYHLSVLLLNLPDSSLCLIKEKGEKTSSLLCESALRALQVESRVVQCRSSAGLTYPWRSKVYPHPLTGRTYFDN